MSLKALMASLACVAVGCAAVAENLNQGAQVETKKDVVQAPDFSASASDGKTYTLKSLTEKKPVFLYFVKVDCGSNGRSVALFNSLYKQYGEKANFLAVINTKSADSYKEWAASYGATVPGVLDPNKEVIKSYIFRASQIVVMVDKDGKIAKTFRGFGKESLTELNASMAEVAGAKVAQVDLSRAPSGIAFG
jgi:peroxiredoxin